jgi:1,4-alpha-glucan branching enzyme
MGSELAPFSEWNESAGLPWHLLDHAAHRGVRDLLAELNRLAASWPALYERDHEPTGFQWLAADDAPHSVYAFLRWGYAGGTAVACVANFTPVPRRGYLVGLPWGGEWQRVLDTDSPAWGGSGFGGYDAAGTASVDASTDIPWQGQPASAGVDVPPLGVVWLAGRRP